MATLYLTEDGSSLSIKENRLQIKKTNETLKEISIEKVDNIVLMGRCHITSPLVTELLEREIPVSWLSKTGKFFGRLEPTTSINIERQREQFRRADDVEFSPELSKIFVSAKIKNSQVVLRRYNRNFHLIEVAEAIEELKRYVLKVENAIAVEELLGYEGNASKIYFKSLGMMIRDEFKFKGRSKQPPRDKFNSLLSFGYTLLLYELYTAITNKGLNPYCSFMHKIRRGHPALCSDLVEEWRSVIVDSLAMNLVQNKILNVEDFLLPDEITGGVYLTRECSKTFISKFETRLKQENTYLTYVDYPLSFRESIQFQVGSLVKAIENYDPSIYRPILIR